jgi:hypothetical protein
MKISVSLDTNGAAAAGVDRDALIANLQAEMDKLADAANAARPEPDKQPPPAGAQGDAAIVQWIIEVATDPAMAKLYAQGLLMALNSIIGAAKKKEVPAEVGDESQSTAKRPVKVTLSGKEIGLPVTTAIIKTFLEDL